jgi:hypothetical protein
VPIFEPGAMSEHEDRVQRRSDRAACINNYARLN